MILEKFVSSVTCGAACVLFQSGRWRVARHLAAYFQDRNIKLKIYSGDATRSAECMFFDVRKTAFGTLRATESEISRKTLIYSLHLPWPCHVHVICFAKKDSRVNELCLKNRYQRLWWPSHARRHFNCRAVTRLNFDNQNANYRIDRLSKRLLMENLKIISCRKRRETRIEIERNPCLHLH